MRRIRITDQPDGAWRQKADALLLQLRNAPDAAARGEIIDANDKVWGELKAWLLNLSHKKCWFSEAKDGFSHWDVEHYRPKKKAKDLDGTEYDAYWWLAFDWRNFRICGNAGNRKKGTFFPLRPGTPRAVLDGELRFEDPQLLDPVDHDDPNLLSFNMEGRAIPAAHVHDDWERTRVEYSVVRYNLDFPQLMDKRKALWAECWNRIKEYQEELERYHNDKTNAVARAGFKKAAEHLREMVREDRELSAVAVACIRGCGDPRVAAIM